MIRPDNLVVLFKIVVELFGLLQRLVDKELCETIYLRRHGVSYLSFK